MHISKSEITIAYNNLDVEYLAQLLIGTGIYINITAK